MHDCQPSAVPVVEYGLVWGEIVSVGAELDTNSACKESLLKNQYPFS